MSSPLDCPHCGALMFRASKDGSRVKARTSILVLHKGGDVEINCAECGHGVLLPLTPATSSVGLRKADAPKLVVREPAALDTARARRA